MAKSRFRKGRTHRGNQVANNRLFLALVVGLVLYSSAVTVINELTAALAAMTLPAKLAWLGFMVGVVLFAGWGLVRALAELAEHKRQRLFDQAELEKMRRMTSSEFEEYAAEIFRFEGWDRAVVTPQTGDVGKDIILWKGEHMALVECKRWEQPVGRPVVQKLHSAMVTSGAREGFLLTTSKASGPAEAYARQVGIMVVAGEELARRARAAFNKR